MYLAFSILTLLNAEFNPICHLLALLGTHHILHVGRIRANAMMWMYEQNFVGIL
jgi:hypothetical protein